MPTAMKTMAGMGSSRGGVLTGAGVGFQGLEEAWHTPHLARKGGNVPSRGKSILALSASSCPELEGSVLGKEPPLQSGLGSKAGTLRVSLGR